MLKTVNANKIITCNPLVFNVMYTWRWPLNVIVITFPIIYQNKAKKQNLVQSVTFVSFLDEQKSKYFPLGNLVKVNRCLKKVAEGWFPRQRRCTRGLLTTTGGSLQLGTDKQQTKEYRVHECSLLGTWHVVKKAAVQMPSKP